MRLMSEIASGEASAEENGWKDLLQAFGPIFLEQQHAWLEIPWEEFPEKNKVWYDGYWTPLCEKYGIDPTIKPIFWDRLDARQYLIKNGITGEETSPDITFDRGELYDYWENHEKKIGVASWKAVEETLASSRERPWTAEEYPNLEKWLEENADMFDAVAAAVRKPRFRCWHFPGGGATSDAEAEPGAYIATLLPDVQSMRDICRLCQTRANFHVGKGDFSGAIDDIETTLLIGKSLMEGNNRTLVERLVGIAVTGIAAAIALDANPNASPSPEERARLVAIWKDAFDATDYTEWGREWARDEIETFWTPMAQLFVQSLRKGKYTLTVFSGEFEGDVADNGAHSLFERPPRFWVDTLKIKSGANKWLLFRGGFDDAAFMREIESLDKAASEGDNQALERTWEELERLLKENEENYIEKLNTVRLIHGEYPACGFDTDHGAQVVGFDSLDDFLKDVGSLDIRNIGHCLLANPQHELFDHHRILTKEQMFKDSIKFGQDKKEWKFLFEWGDNVTEKCNAYTPTPPKIVKPKDQRYRDLKKMKICIEELTKLDPKNKYKDDLPKVIEELEEYEE